MRYGEINANQWLPAKFLKLSLRIEFQENPLLGGRIETNLDIFTCMAKSNSVVQSFEGHLSIAVDLAIKGKGGEVIKHTLEVKKDGLPFGR